MYTSYIGKKFLKIYKEKENKPINYTAKEFFNEVLYPVFFNDEKHFLNVANSSFFQPVSSELIKSGKSIHLLKLERFHKNVREGPSLTTLVGYSAQDLKAGTSGQVTSLNCSIDDDEMYSSWIGSGLTIAMGGGYSILVDINEVIWKIFLGWLVYRKTLKQTDNLKGNQIDVWNSYWIIHSLSDNFNEQNPEENFIVPDSEICKAEKWKKLGYLEFSSNSWIKVLFTFSKKNFSILTVNAFKFADTNQTLGFINIYLSDVRRMFELRDKLFLDKEQSILSDNEIETLEPFYRFNDACKMGTIGLKSIEPRGLREFMTKGTVDYASGNEYKFTNEKSLINFQLYKLWIIAMLNKTELLKLASVVANALSVYETQDSKENRGKNDKLNQVKDILESKSLKSFIDCLTSIISKENAEVFKLVIEGILKMPSDNFLLFATLIRFEYTYLKI